MTASTPSAMTSKVAVDHGKPIALRLPPDALARTMEHAADEQRTPANFVRMLFLRALEQYEAELASNNKAH